MTADATALVAALLCAACPIAMQMGTTAQSEPLFALLVLGIAIAFERRRYGATAAMLGAAVLLRYEAWAIFATVALSRSSSRSPPGAAAPRAQRAREPTPARSERGPRARRAVDRRGGADRAHPRVGRAAPPGRRAVVRLPRADARVREPGRRGRSRRAWRRRPRARRPLLPRLRRRARPRSRGRARGLRRRAHVAAAGRAVRPGPRRVSRVRVAHLDEPIVSGARSALRRRRSALRDVRRAGRRGDRRAGSGGGSARGRASARRAPRRAPSPARCRSVAWPCSA